MSGHRFQLHLERSPIFLRAFPFVLFVVPIYLQGALGPTSPFWVYAMRTILGVGLVVWMLPRVREIGWAMSLEGAAAGVLVFIVWIGLNRVCPSLHQLLAPIGLGWLAPEIKPEGGWNPLPVFGEASWTAWTFVVIRLAGSSLVVPPIEEVFYRSFLYRFVIKQDFESVSMRTFDLKAFLAVSVMFGLSHPQDWLAGILCGVIYQGLVLRRGRLGDAIVAHSLTNFLLGLWVIGRGEWHFW